MATTLHLRQLPDGRFQLFTKMLSGQELTYTLLNEELVEVAQYYGLSPLCESLVEAKCHLSGLMESGVPLPDAGSYFPLL